MQRDAAAQVRVRVAVHVSVLRRLGLVGRHRAGAGRRPELVDEEEGPPPYDSTPDKAKPAKHRSSVEVDELWPAAGVAGAGAAAAANESKAADGDMDCDSDSDLGSRISLHAPM